MRSPAYYTVDDPWLEGTRYETLEDAASALAARFHSDDYIIRLTLQHPGDPFWSVECFNDYDHYGEVRRV